MVSFRCKMIVRSELEKLHLNCIIVELGEVEIKEKIAPHTKGALKNALLRFGLELIEDKKAGALKK